MRPKARCGPPRIAHVDGQVPNVHIELEYYDATLRGIALFLLCGRRFKRGVQRWWIHFNQPGVEAYKVNMFALLGKPGFEKEKEAIQSKDRN
jgi:Glucose-6-phosphate isomerase